MITGLQYASLSDIGEGFEEKRAPKGHRTPFGTIFIIANGMEGEESAETAGQKTIDLIKATLRQSDEISPSRALEQAFDKAHEEIWSDFKQKASLREQSYGLVAMLLTDEMAHIGHLGGSRVYLMRGETFARMKHTHDLAQNGAKGKEHKTYSMQLAPEDTFLLCSDGLSCPSDDSVIEQSLRQDALYEAMRIFAEEDKASGIQDNTAIALIRVEALPVVFGHNTPSRQTEAPPLPGALKGGFDTETGDWIAFQESDVDQERLFAKLEDTWQDISIDLEKNKRALAVTLATLKEEEDPQEDSLDDEIQEIVGIFDEASLDAAFGLDEEDDDNPFSNALRESLAEKKKADEEAQEAPDELPLPPSPTADSQDDAPEDEAEENAEEVDDEAILEETAAEDAPPVPLPPPEAKAPPADPTPKAPSQEPKAQGPRPKAQKSPDAPPAPRPVAPIQAARSPSPPAPSTTVPMVIAGLVALLVGLLIGFQIGASGKGELQDSVKAAEKRTLDSQTELETLRSGATDAKQALATANDKLKAAESERDDLQKRLAAIKVTQGAEEKLKALTDENAAIKEELEEKKLELKNLRWTISKGNVPN